MDIRRQPIGRGLAWLAHAVNVGGRRPRAVFGAALLFIGVMYAALFLGMASVLVGIDAKALPDPVELVLRMLPALLLFLCLVPVLLGGLMHVVREAEADRPVRVRDLFEPFRARKAGSLALLGLVQVLFGLLAVLVVPWLAGPDYWHDYMESIRSAMGGTLPVMPEPRHPGLLLLAQLVFNYFSYAIMLFSVPLILFSGTGLVEAIRLSVAAALRNVGPCLLAAALFMVGTIAATVVMLLLLGFAAVLGNAVHPILASVLELILMMVFSVALLAVVTSATYAAWRDVFEGGTVPPAEFAA
jgi:hypothetical protein